MRLLKKAMLAVITMVLAVVAIVVPANKKATKVEAATTWSLAGDFQGWNAGDKTYTLEYNAAKTRFEIVVTFKAGAQFKIVKNYAWTTSIGWDNYSTDKGKGTYLSNSGGNFKVKTAGDYLIYLNENNSAGYTPWAGDVGIEIYTLEKHTVTYHAATTETEEYSDGQVWTSKFVEKEGYRLEGWYTDANLTKKFVKGTAVTSDLDLYPNYVVANDYKVYFKDNNTFGATANAYSWSDEYGNNTGAWPGVKMTKVGNVWEVVIDASKSCDKIIFNNGTVQTVDLDLVTESAVYVIGAKDTEGHYAATATALTTVDESIVTLGYQVGTHEELKALRLVAKFDLEKADLTNLYSAISWKVTRNGVADEREVTALYSQVDPMNGSAVMKDAYFAVLTYTNIPAGEYTVELLVDGVAVAAITAVVA